MAEFINTIDVLGDDAVIDSIIDRTITEFKDDKLTTVGQYAFYGCAALKSVNIPSAVSLAPYAFLNCTNLETIDCMNVANFGGGHVFRGCSSLKIIKIPLLKAFLTGSEFNGCSSLECADFSSLSKIRSSFQNCSSLVSLILRREAAATLDSSAAFNNTPIASGTGYIYVPRALIEDYKVATNWSNFATQFRALEDYTVDGTITGELDETKI